MVIRLEECNGRAAPKAAGAAGCRRLADNQVGNRGNH